MVLVSLETFAPIFNGLHFQKRKEKGISSALPMEGNFWSSVEAQLLDANLTLNIQNQTF